MDGHNEALATPPPSGIPLAPASIWSKCTKPEDGCRGPQEPLTRSSYHTDVATNSDSALMSALAQQPHQFAFQLYKSGVFTAASTLTLTGVLAVGYGTFNGFDYYKVKNSA